MLRIRMLGGSARVFVPIALTSSPGLSIPNVDVVELSTGSRPLTVDLAPHYSSSAGM